MWSVSSILTGLLSFMMEDKSTYGSITTSFEEKRVYADKSFEYNQKNKTFTSLFPDMIENYKKMKKEEEKKEKIETSSNSKSEESNWINFLILMIFFISVIYFSW